MNWEARIAQIVAGLIVFATLVTLGYFFAQAFLTEADFRMQRLEQHRMAMAAPAAPTGLTFEYRKPANVRSYQDASRRKDGK